MKNFGYKNKFQQDKKSNKPPRFYVLRIYFFAFLLYFMLVMPFVIVTHFKEINNFLKNDNFNMSLTEQPFSANKTDQSDISQLNNATETASDTKVPIQDELNTETSGIELNTPGNIKKPSRKNNNPQGTEAIQIRNDSEFNKSGSLSLKIFLIILIGGYLFNLPFKSYFSKKRKGKRITKAHYNFVRRFCLQNPIINAWIFGAAFLIQNGINIFNLNYYPEQYIDTPWFEKTIYISLIASLLAVLFVYFWEKHRLHIKYIEHIFSAKELRKSIFKFRLGKIKTRLWISSLMTTILPLSLVGLYLYISPTRLSPADVNNLTIDQKRLLFGYATDFMENDESVFFYNSIDSTFMTVGVAIGIFTAFIYIFFFLSWTTKDIVSPVSALLEQVHRMGRGNLDSYGAVRTNDEIGELTQGFNEMTDKLNMYFQGIQRINEANARFVPKQFLEFLGKESIDEINLGDQVQKEMTVMFSDIRDFTNLSEKMSPKENFDFLNNYLGVMEPVIHKHQGFIDKFIGDAIMALFPKNVDQAIDAAIDMRHKLFEFNIILKQYGREAIDSGIGIHTGNLMLGIVGGEKRMDGTVISDAVNLSARLEGLTKKYGVSIILSEETVSKIKDSSKYQLRCIDIVKVKGKNQAVKIYEVLNGEPPKQRDLKNSTKENFKICIKLYKSGDFKGALSVCEKLQIENPKDKVFEIYRQRCIRYLEIGKPKEWNGIEVLDSK